MGGLGRDERAWIRGAQAGSASDLEALFRYHWPRAYRAAFLVVHDHAAAEDIAQEAFLNAVRNLERFDRERPFGPWLHRIVVNRAIDWARARIGRREVSGESYLEPTDRLVRQGGNPHVGSDAKAIALGLASLPPEQRAVIVLRYLLEYTPGEIAELLELPRGTVNSRLRRGLDALEVQLGGGRE
jgi:RNA polymerase sigma-70 factor (ECF subfamily)